MWISKVYRRFPYVCVT